MSYCFSPIPVIKYRTGGKHEDGTPKYALSSSNWTFRNSHDFISRYQNDPEGDYYLNPLYHRSIYLDHFTGEVSEPFLIPCGKCPGCLMSHSQEWANRMLMECQTSDRERCWFITFTYDDDHLPYSEFGIPTLRKKHAQDFLKRLRFYCGSFRYFLAGEYGSQSGRPHYHGVFFNLHLMFDDLKLHGSNFDGDSYYISKSFSDVWDNGFCVITPYTYGTGAYVSRYVTKKVFQDNVPVQATMDSDFEMPFQLQSLKPGLGYEYFEEHKESICRSDRIIIPGSAGQMMSFNIPRYFEKFIEPVLLSKMKEFRKSRGQDFPDPYGISQYQKLIDEQDQFLKKIKTLKRLI